MLATFSLTDWNIMICQSLMLVASVFSVCICISSLSLSGFLAYDGDAKGAYSVSFFTVWSEDADVVLTLLSRLSTF